ncbi:hypothetical protein [Pseudomonas edaphica]|uniref:hypothetical protein n=1 Tax=Pseudomonas edaphica TaxID=2006980 RepID=UPI0011096B91|nr:hypothetical protein [Pseudomonas edaphica]
MDIVNGIAPLSAVDDIQHKCFFDHFTSNPITFRESLFYANLASFREQDMDKESTLKSDICIQLIFRVVVARATYEAETWVCGPVRG